MTTLLDYRLAEAKRLNLRVLNLKVREDTIINSPQFWALYHDIQRGVYQGVPVEIVK